MQNLRNRANIMCRRQHKVEAGIEVVNSRSACSSTEFILKYVPSSAEQLGSLATERGFPVPEALKPLEEELGGGHGGVDVRVDHVAQRHVLLHKGELVAHSQMAEGGQPHRPHVVTDRRVVRRAPREAGRGHSPQRLQHRRQQRARNVVGMHAHHLPPAFEVDEGLARARAHGQHHVWEGDDLVLAIEQQLVLCFHVKEIHGQRFVVHSAARHLRRGRVDPSLLPQPREGKLL
mmetsp:Transcript_20709/g.39359  ORF Transcript_20709/g.39359 Transcript_20709/m.39359 type:complete len:233 (+) Transcript_20709:565-1263(+)